jgi:hypothetical protein
MLPTRKLVVVFSQARSADNLELIDNDVAVFREFAYSVAIFHLSTFLTGIDQILGT